MKFVIITAYCAVCTFYFPYDETKTCQEQGNKIIQEIANYQEDGDIDDGFWAEGWYTNKENARVSGFRCGEKD